MKREFFDVFIQVIENMSDEKVTIYTSPKNAQQVQCLIMYAQNQMNNAQQDERDMIP